MGATCRQEGVQVLDILLLQFFNAGMLQASQILLSDPTLHHEYLPITGLPEFVSSAARLILGEHSPAIAERRVVSVQTISGTGANHLAALFLSRYYPFNGDKVVYLSDPTWGTCSACLWDPSVNAYKRPALCS
jgi:aspartate/tyrosine/aromatic aminotransferase